MIVLEAIQLSSDFLKRKSVESSRLNAEILLAEILGIKRLELYLKYDKPLTQSETDKYREFIVRRSKGEPLQYITGHTEFYGHDFLVNPTVLIPRNDTEILVEHAIDFIQKSEKKFTVLDIGTGSGNIAICISMHCPNVELYAIDISHGAIELAKKNAARNDLLGNICFIEGDIKNYDFLDKKFDLIISNPPYISLNGFNELQREVHEYEPRIALTDESDGLKYFKVISKEAREILNNNGLLMFEVGYDQSESVKEILLENSFEEISVIKDYSKIDRVVQARLK